MPKLLALACVLLLSACNTDVSWNPFAKSSADADTTMADTTAAAETMAESTDAAGEEAHDDGPTWGYTGDTGPAHWAGLGFGDCDGPEQSPIDLTRAEVAALPDLSFAYQPAEVLLHDTGHAIQADVAEGGALTIAEDTYQLVQLHFHTPSEHTVDGESYPAEVHFVHQDGEGNLAVVGVLIEEGAADPLLSRLVSSLPASEAEEASLTLNPNGLLPSDKDYFTYDGSLTTPPCTEGVRWVVLHDPITMSPQQRRLLAQRYPANARYTQPLRGRTLRTSGE